MASLNKVMLIGNLGRDPEIRYTEGSGDPVCNFSVATTDKWKSKSGDPMEKTEWHDCVVFGRTADLMMEYCQAGTMVYVEGALQTRSWDDAEGNKKYKTEIKVFKINWLSKTKSFEENE